MTDHSANKWAPAIYLVALVCAAAAVSCLFLQRYYLSDILLSCRISGYGALAFLAFTLSVASIVRIGDWLGLAVAPTTAQSWVKHSGRSAALLSLVHAGVVLAAYLKFDWMALWQVTYLRSGAAAAGILVLLLITSSKRINQWIDWQLFKPLHRLIYVAAALVLHHLLLSPFASRWWTLACFTTLAVLLATRLLPLPKRAEKQSQRCCSTDAAETPHSQP